MPDVNPPLSPQMPSPEGPPKTADVGGAAQVGGPLAGSSSPDAHPAELFSACMTLMAGLGSLNYFLSVFSQSILQVDLKQDGAYATSLAKINFKSGGSSVAAYNEQQELNEQVIQAKMKAHQSTEQLDIQTASGTTSTIQQLSTIISQTLQLIGSIANAINQMNR